MAHQTPEDITTILMAIGHLRGIVERVETRLAGLEGIHTECSARLRREAYTNGLERGRTELIVDRITKLEKVNQNKIEFKKTLVAGVILSLFGSIIAVIKVVIANKPIS